MTLTLDTLPRSTRVQISRAIDDYAASLSPQQRHDLERARAHEVPIHFEERPGEPTVLVVSFTYPGDSPVPLMRLDARKYGLAMVDGQVLDLFEET